MMDHRPAPLDGLLAEVTQVVGKRALLLRHSRSGTGGLTPVLHRIVEFADGSTGFLKAALPGTESAIRAEVAVYSLLGAKPFMPRLDGCDSGDQPWLVIENLEDASWPPPWDLGQISIALATLDQVHAAIAPSELPTLRKALAIWSSWTQVATNPEPFLSLALCTSSWLERSLPTLLDASERAILDGNELVHLDPAHNMCFRDQQTILLDWPKACRGNGLFDLHLLLPSLHAEGGPPPECLARQGAAEHAAWLSGHWASQAAAAADTPLLRGIRQSQLEQLRIALPWAARELGLEPLAPHLGS